MNKNILVIGARFVPVIAALNVAVAAFAQEVTKPAPSAFQIYKASGIISGGIIKEQVAQMAGKREPCSKPLEVIAFENLTEDHRDQLTSSFADNFPLVGAFKSAKSLFQRFTTGTTDLQQALYMLDVNRGAAIRYKSEWCAEPRRESMVSAQDLNGANVPTSCAFPPTENPAEPPRKVTGLDDWEGEIIGQPISGSKFELIKIGMTASQVIALLGQPDDQCFRVTAKALLPFNFGSDKYRLEHAYKGVGRLIFSNAQAPGGITEMHLVWVIVSPVQAGLI